MTTALGEYIKEMVERQERENNIKFLKALPDNTFYAILQENGEIWAGARYNDKYYSEWEIYIAYLERDSDNEPLI